MTDEIKSVFQELEAWVAAWAAAWEGWAEWEAWAVIRILETK